MIAIPPLDFSSIDLTRFRESLRESISVFHEIDQPMQFRVVDFLINGHDAEVLLDLRAALRRHGITKFFRLESRTLKPVNYQLSCTMLRLFKQSLTPPGYYQRLGQVCSQYPGLEHAPFTGDKRLPKWFNDLILFAVTLMYGVEFQVKEAERTCDCAPLLASLSEQETNQFLRLIVQSHEQSGSAMICGLGYLSGTGKYLEGNLDRLMAICLPEDELHEQLVSLLETNYVKPGKHLQDVIKLGMKVSRNNRSSIQGILERNKTEARPLLVQFLNKGDKTQRKRAAELLNKLYGRTIAPELAAALASEKDREVRASIEKFYSVYRDAEAYEQSLKMQLALPSVELAAGELPLPAGFVAMFQAYLDEALVQSKEQYKQSLHSYAMTESTDIHQSRTRPTPPSTDSLLATYIYMEGKSTVKPPANAWLFRVLQDSPSIQTWCNPRQLHLVQLMRLLDAVGGLQERSSALAVYHFRLLNQHRLAQVMPYGLREIDAAAELIFGRPDLMSRGYLMDAARYDFEDNAIWPAYTHQLKLLEESIAGVPFDQFDRTVPGRRQTALAIAGMLPVLPKQLEEAAWSLAFSDGCTLRPIPRALLKRQANCLQRAIAALGNRSSGARMGAAELLQELGQPEAIEPLKKALKREKLTPVQGYFLTALDQLGANVDEFIGRDKLLQDALKADRRPTRSMMWFDLKEVPNVRWASDDKPVDRVVLELWLLQCVRFKSTTCSSIMRRALAMCRRDDTLRLAHHILDKWIAFDTDEPDRIELEKRIRSEAQQLFKVFRVPGKNTEETTSDIESHIRRLINEELRSIQQQQSAHPERGLLAIVAAFGDAGCVAKMEDYIRNYHGNRALQAKDMLEVIPQIDDPTSLRVMCSLAAGFRNAAISKRAGELLRDLSERIGWTEEELAERTIPDAGFSLTKERLEEHVAQPPYMLLSYGRRQFRIVLKDDFETIVQRDDGSLAAELPSANKEDDKTLVRVAKAQLKTTRQVVQATKLQLAELFFHAMCSARTWTVKDWRERFLCNPVAGIACRRLVWSVQLDKDERTNFFQLLTDGSFVDGTGQVLQLQDDWKIRVAHPDQMESSLEQHWLQHLTAQGIHPLFHQTQEGIQQYGASTRS